jgi:hypothetical protein
MGKTELMYHPAKKTATSYTISNSVTSIGNCAFDGCSNLTSVTIPNSVTFIGGYAFGYCTGLTSVTIPNSVTTIGDRAFEGCNSLTSVSIPNSVTSIGDYAFEYCTGLISVTIPNSVTTIGVGAFDVCSGLTAFTVESDNPSYSAVDGVLFNKGKTMLMYYPAKKTATSYTIPNSVTTIENGAFGYCTGLISVTIPSSVITIEGAAFFDCSGLTSVTVSWSDPASVEYGSSIFYNMPKATLYVPKGTEALYRAIEPWSRFDNIVESATANEPVISNRLQVFTQGSALTVNGVKTGETINLFDMNGRLLFTLRTAGETETISVAHLPRSIYIVRTADRAVKVRLR